MGWPVWIAGVVICAGFIFGAAELLKLFGDWLARPR